MADFDWDDLQVFLALAREGQLSRAARVLGSSHVTVSRRVDRLEGALKLRLFERNPRGYVLTGAGRRLVETAERMEAEAARLGADLAEAAFAQGGTLRLAVPEGFGSFFSHDMLPDFTRRFPRISLELITLTQVLALSRREADISVTLDPAKAGPYRSERIVDYSLHIYGARSYLDARPPIGTRDDLRGQTFIGYIPEMIFAPGLDYLGEVHPAIRPWIKSSSIFNQLAAARGGLGLCVLPDYIARDCADLHLVLPDQVALTRSYWLTCHRDLRQIPRERAVIAYLTEALRAREGQLLRHNRTLPPDSGAD